MVLTASTMLPLGTKAPSFSLKDAGGRAVSLNDFNAAQALLVIFMCNHCPYVKHVGKELAALTKEYMAKGVAVAGINSNDAEKYSDDSPANMAREAKAAGYVFPYLFDESQAVAKAYRAACTPEFYVFDGNQKLVYRGQMDASRPGGNIPVTGVDVRRALDAVLGGTEVAGEQRPGMGCNIKWKPGNEPDYFRP
ncbi:MAG: thioredoxin family protein [Nitrospinae bacterium]|nr:thioredoxin family protein [Nitrospinota bacterium]